MTYIFESSNRAILRSGGQPYNCLVPAGIYLSEIPGFLYIFWDNIMIHRIKKVKKFLGDNNDRLITRRIPAYSPELNPDEFVWNVLKCQELPNFCPDSSGELESTVLEKMMKLKDDPARVRKTVRGSKLPLPL